MDLAKALRGKDKNATHKSGIYYVLEIVDPEYRIPGVRLFKDPDYADYGVYTLQAIDPKVIDKIKEFKLI